MDLRARRYQFIRELIKVDKVSVMDKIESILKKDQPTERETLAEYNEEIDQVIQQIEKGEFYTHDQVVKNAEKWQAPKKWYGVSWHLINWKRPAVTLAKILRNLHKRLEVKFWKKPRIFRKLPNDIRWINTEKIMMEVSVLSKNTDIESLIISIIAR